MNDIAYLQTLLSVCLSMLWRGCGR